MSTEPPTETHQFTKSYKHMWARRVARTTMEYDLKGAIDRIKSSAPAIGVEKNDTVGGVFDKMKTNGVTGKGFVPEKRGKIDVGIVGAGVAGLFSALLFDWLNQHPNLKDKGLRISYDILEAAGPDRLGGRLYTHHFTDEDHDYYDVGAMRFPNNSIMKRTFQLFNYIGIKRDSQPGLIPYYMSDVKDVCPSYFNDVPKVGNAWPKEPKAADPYKINSGLPEDGKIPEDLLKVKPSDLVEEALGGFTSIVKEHFQEAIAEQEEAKKEGKNYAGDSVGPKETKLWKLLMRADHMSVRQFLGSGQRKKKILTNGEEAPLSEPSKEEPSKEEPFPPGPGYNYNTIEWLETATFGTGWYDQALTECVLEQLDFYTPEKKDTQYWWCVDGGAQEIAKKMASKANKRIEYNTRVEAIDAQLSLREQKKPDDFTSMKLRTTRTDPITKKTETKERSYFAIFNSTTLGSLQRMELRDAGLLYGTKQASRALGYGASSKVGIKFRTAWWQKDPFNITQGGIARTDLPLRVCVYPSYNIEANEGEKWDPEKSAVLLCSYTWGQDAQRIGSLCSKDTPHNEEELKRLMLHNLARLHANDKRPFEELLKILENEYVDHHAWDWYKDPNMSGAFAWFGPGQFSNMWQEITKPNSYGQLYLVGEAASSHHAWIVGALESVIRAVYVMFQGLQSHDTEFEAYEIVLDLLRGPPLQRGKDHANKAEDLKQPLKEDGSLPTGLPFHPLPEEMPTRQYKTPIDTPLTDNPVEEVRTDGDTQMFFGAALASLALIESYVESWPRAAAVST